MITEGTTKKLQDSFKARIPELLKTKESKKVLKLIKKNDYVSFGDKDSDKWHTAILESMNEAGITANDVLKMKRGTAHKNQTFSTMMILLNDVLIQDEAIKKIKIDIKNRYYSKGMLEWFTYNYELINKLQEQYVIKTEDGKYSVANFLKDLGVDYYSIGYCQSRVIENNEDAQVLCHALVRMAKYGLVVMKTKRTMKAYEFTQAQGRGDGVYSAQNIELKEAVEKINKLKEERIVINTESMAQVTDKVLLEEI